MAEEQEAPSEKSEAKPAQGSARSVVLAAALLTLLAIVLGGGIGYLMSQSIEKNIQTKADTKNHIDDTKLPKSYTDNIILVKLEPITTNLSTPDSVFIKIESSLVVDKNIASQKDFVTVLSAEIQQDILVYLRTLTLAQIQGPGGLQNLREDLADRVAIRSEGKIREFILETMVVQ